MEDDKPTGDAPAPPSWEYRKSFHATERLKKVVSLTIDASKAEVDRLRKRINKLTYGS